MEKLILRCPRCGTRGRVRTRIKTGERVCAFCGYVAKPEEFEVKPKK